MEKNVSSPSIVGSSSVEIPDFNLFDWNTVFSSGASASQHLQPDAAGGYCSPLLSPPFSPLSCPLELEDQGHSCSTPHNSMSHLHLLPPLKRARSSSEDNSAGTSQKYAAIQSQSSTLEPGAQQQNVVAQPVWRCANMQHTKSEPSAAASAANVCAAAAPSLCSAECKGNTPEFHIEIKTRRPRSFLNGVPVVACGCRRSLTVKVTSTKNTPSTNLDGFHVHLVLEVASGDGSNAVPIASGGDEIQSKIGVYQNRPQPEEKAPESTRKFPAFAVGQHIRVPLKFDSRLNKRHWKGTVDYRFCNVQQLHGPYRWNAVIHDANCKATCSCSYQLFYVNKKN